MIVIKKQLTITTSGDIVKPLTIERLVEAH